MPQRFVRHRRAEGLLRRQTPAYQCRRTADGLREDGDGRVLVRYSTRSATIGSTSVARRAGLTLARSATPARKSATLTKLTRPAGHTATSRDLTTRVIPNAPASPTAMPTATQHMPGPPPNPTPARR